MPDEWTEADEAVEEVWEIRRQIWARFDDDVETLMAYYLERDKRCANRTVDAPHADENGKSAA